MTMPREITTDGLPGALMLRAAGWLVLSLFWWGGGNAALAARSIDYLYVEANEADSSGGHAAIRFGTQTFHFQHEDPGILRLRRHDASVFDHLYTMLGNRSIRESRIGVSDDTYELLRNAFARLQLIQDGHLATRDALHRDVALFEQLLDRYRSGGNGVNGFSFPLRGVGYFLPDNLVPVVDPPTGESDAGTADSRSPVLQALRERMRATHGQRFIAEQIALTEEALREMELRVSRPPLPVADDGRYPIVDLPVSTRYENGLMALFAFRLLQDAPSLRPGSFWMPSGDTYRLDPRETRYLKNFAAQLEEALLKLVDSSRPDWGLPFIVGMARLAAIEASLSSGRLVFLDIYPAGGEAHPSSDATRPYLPAMAHEMREVFQRRRTEFFTEGSLREADYASLERTGNRLLDLERAISTGTPPRVIPAAPYPAREARRTDLVLPKSDASHLESGLAAARQAEDEFTAALATLYRYDLVRRNCVTEIFAVINRSLERRCVANSSPATDSRDVLREESERRLGGFVDPSRGFTFIPFVSAGEVASSYGVIARAEHPSYRSARLAAMREHEPPPTVFLRESNTLTSTIYRPAPTDSPFLFFTDDTPLLRPPFGAINFLVGLGTSIVGVATLPVEGTDRFLAGVKGMLFSLPELVFVNLRKGSMVFVEQSNLPSAGW